MRHRPHVAANASTVARRLDEITRIGKEFRTFLPRLAADDWQALPVVDTGAEGVGSSSHVHAALFTAPHRSEAATSSWVLMVNGGATRRSVSVVAGGRKLSKTLEPWDVVMVDDVLHVASKTDDPAARAAPPPLNMLDGAYFVSARHLAAAGDATMLRAVAAINASAYMHLPESHVHDTARSRNQTIQDIGPFSVMNKTMNAPSGDRHDFLCISAYCT